MSMTDLKNKSKEELRSIIIQNKCTIATLQKTIDEYTQQNSNINNIISLMNNNNVGNIDDNDSNNITYDDRSTDSSDNDDKENTLSPKTKKKKKRYKSRNNNNNNSDTDDNVRHDDNNNNNDDNSNGNSISEVIAKDWTEDKKKAWKDRSKDENGYYLRYTSPGIELKTGKWSNKEHGLFIKALQESGENIQWGIFSKSIPGRVGYQCRNFWLSLTREYKAIDPNRPDKDIAAEIIKKWVKDQEIKNGKKTNININNNNINNNNDNTTKKEKRKLNNNNTHTKEQISVEPKKKKRKLNNVKPAWKY